MRFYLPKHITIVISLAVFSMGLTLIIIVFLGQSSAIIPSYIYGLNSDQIFIIFGFLLIFFSILIIIVSFFIKKI
jgi:hypothetical protein